ARARTAELGPDWPTIAKALYTAIQLALTGRALLLMLWLERRSTNDSHSGRGPRDWEANAHHCESNLRAYQAPARDGYDLSRARDRLHGAVLRLPGSKERPDGVPGVHDIHLLHRRSPLGLVRQLRRSTFQPTIPYRVVQYDRVYDRLDRRAILLWSGDSTVLPPPIPVVRVV